MITSLDETDLDKNLLSGGFEKGSSLVQRFNVVCVTKRSDLHVAHFHREVTGEATVNSILYRRTDINIMGKAFVTFLGKSYDLVSIRNGLDGAALVIGIQNYDEIPYTVWELYTDTPSGKPDSQDRTKTAKEIRELALEAIKRSSNS